jgi:hypothetical protein
MAFMGSNKTRLSEMIVSNSLLNYPLPLPAVLTNDNQNKKIKKKSIQSKN